MFRGPPARPRRSPRCRRVRRDVLAPGHREIMPSSGWPVVLAVPRRMESQDYLMLFVLAALWGASFLFIKVAVGEMSPVFLVFGRSLAAALGLAIALPLARISLDTLRRHWKPGLVIALFNCA